MYEENCRPLPEGDAAQVFAAQLREMQHHLVDEQPMPLNPETVLRWGNRCNQPFFAAMCRRLLLPGSRIEGLSNLENLATLARNEHSCLICLNHRSNFDVPTLQALLEDANNAPLFEKLIWIAGRKLEEDTGPTRIMVQCFNRVIVTPLGWFAGDHTEDQVHEARRLNIAADRAIATRRHDGWIFALFPSGTRIRPGDESTRHAIEQTDSFLKNFEYLALCHIDGCTLPVTKDRDLTHETPQLSRMIYTFGPVLKTEQWRSEAAARFPQADQRTASAKAIEADIDALAVGHAPHDKK